MTNKSKRESCRPLYKQLQILTLPSQYIFSLLIFVVKNKDLFLSNSEIHTIDTRNNSNLHIPHTNLTLFQKGVLYSGCKIYNRLPPYIKSLSNDLKRFKSSLKGYLMERTLYSIDEFHQITWYVTWFLLVVWSMCTIYCKLYFIGRLDNPEWLYIVILYYVYLYILTDSMSTKMYMEGKINYNYNCE